MDIKFPLNRLSRFCKHFQKLISNVDIELNLYTSAFVGIVANPNVAPFNANNPNSSFNLRISALFGAPNAQMVIYINTIRLDLVTYNPAPKTIVRLNEVFSSKFTVDYIDCLCAQFPAQHTIAARGNIVSMTVDIKKQMQYLILVFKNTSTNSNTQNYGTFVNGNINSIQIQYGRGGNSLYPSQPQNDDFTMMGNPAYTSGPLHFYEQYKNLFERWNECDQPLSYEEFRDLYTMYCFDLTDLNDVDKDVESTLSVTINRTLAQNETTTQFENYYLLYYKRKATFDFTQSEPIITVE